ncbi:MAG TPA: zinc-dependent alcohol dehydrogenase family protein [Candidatus Binatia bacterium]|nr:zinc-dependent alcohol dehydrogenase family protein [Candidatus Binatia bacterium]
MRVMMLERPAPVESDPLHPRDVPTPVPGRGELCVRVRVCGLCHTDLHTVEGDVALPVLPIVPGHQIVGTVDALGEGVTAFAPGDRVGIPWLHATDGTCAYCRRGDENLCDAARFTGYHVDGGYAEYTVVGAAFAYRIPQVFDDEHAAPLLCAGVIGYRSLRLSAARPGERLGLYGFGASAHLVLQMARHLGCEVYVFTRGVAHRQLATALGAAWVGGAEDVPPRPLDAAIVFAPAGALVPAALRVTRKGATVALAGITMSPIPEMDYALLYHERTLRSVANSTRDDARALLRLAAEVPLRTEVRVYPLAEANRALQDLKRSQIEGAGVLRVS